MRVLTGQARKFVAHNFLGLFRDGAHDIACRHDCVYQARVLGRRTITIPTPVIAELRAHLIRLQERRLLLGLGRATRDDLLFPRWDGQVRSPHWLTQKFAQAIEALKIKGVTLHSLRHTHASQLIAAGMDVLTISRKLGHGSAAITLRVYGHLIEGKDAEAAEVMERIFSGLGTE
jgi:integrase